MNLSFFKKVKLFQDMSFISNKNSNWIKMTNQALVEFTAHFLVALLVPCIFPETLVSIVIVFGAKETLKLFLYQNFGNFFTSPDVKTKGKKKSSKFSLPI